MAKELSSETLKRSSDVQDKGVLTWMDVMHTNSMFNFAGIYYFDSKIDPEKLKTAAAAALELFPVVAGALNEAEPMAYEAGANDGLHFEVWESDDASATAESLAAKEAHGDYRCEHKTLCNLKLTLFPSASVLGCSWKHALGDGYSTFAFLSSVAKLYNGDTDVKPRRVTRDPLKPLPMADYAAEVEGKGGEALECSTLKIHSGERMKQFEADLGAGMRAGITWFTLKFSKDDMEKIKANAMAKKPAGIDFVSTMDALVGHLTAKYAEMRYVQAGIPTPEQLDIVFPYNWRYAFPDYFDETYIGNALTFMSGSIKSSELAENGGAKIAADIRSNINKYVNVESYCKEELWRKANHAPNDGKIVECHVFPKLPHSGFCFTDWTKFAVFDVAFPTKAHSFELSYAVPLPWVSILIPAKDGGAEIKLNLPDKYRAAFEKVYSEKFFHAV